MKTIIIEDEKGAAEVLYFMINRVARDIEIVSMSSSVEEAYESIKKHSPDLVFLDIRLKDKTAFDLLEKFDNIDFKIIFTTAYDDFAVNAFKYAALDYLLKPIDPIELKNALNRARKYFDQNIEYQKMLSKLEQYIHEQNKNIVLNTSQGKTLVKKDEIIRLEADGAYTVFVLKEKNLVVSRNLKYYEKILGDANFLRVHQSHLVNMLHMESVKRDGNMLLKNGDKIPISTRKKQEVLNFLKKKQK
jgi:two-component system LytT family response regulator